MNEIFIILILFATLGIVGTAFLLNYKDSRYDKISFKESLDLADLPIVTFYSGNKKLNFLLDTGSNRSLINAKDLNDCAFKREEYANSLLGMDGIERQVENVTIYLQYKNSKYTEICQVTDLSEAFDYIKKSNGITIHGILGNSFFNEYKYIIDFDDLVAYSKRKL